MRVVVAGVVFSGAIYIAGRPATYSGESRSLEYIDTPLCRVHKIAFTFY